MGLPEIVATVTIGCSVATLATATIASLDTRRRAKVHFADENLDELLACVAAVTKSTESEEAKLSASDRYKLDSLLSGHKEVEDTLNNISIDDIQKAVARLPLDMTEIPEPLATWREDSHFPTAVARLESGLDYLFRRLGLPAQVGTDGR